VAFEVVTLQGQAPPILLTKRGNPIGGERVVVPARLAGAKPDLNVHTHERYRFRIGLSQVEGIPFW
jgi:hypothetical protein